MNFYKCEVCKNIIIYVKDEHVPVKCCGNTMKKLESNTVDAASEKHVPVVNVDGKTVTVMVGSVAHPMLDVHYIEWICIETTNGYQIKHLNPGDDPKAEFVLTEGEKLISAYEHCNLHGLWEKKLS